MGKTTVSMISNDLVYFTVINASELTHSFDL
jgi:hypothetical protein